MEQLTVTKDIAIRAIVCGACKVPMVGTPVSYFSTYDLIWAENLFDPTELKAFRIPLWAHAGYGAGDGAGYGDCYGAGTSACTGDGDGTNYGYRDGAGYGGDGSGYGTGGYGDGTVSGTGAGYGADDGAEYGYGYVSDLGKKILAVGKSTMPT